MHGVSRRELHEQRLVRLLPERRQQLRIIGDDDHPAAPGFERFDKVETLSAVEVGQHSADVGVTLFIPCQKQGAVLLGHRFGADDRRYPGVARGIEKAGYGIEAVAVGEGEGLHAHFLRVRAERFRRVDPPVGGEGGVDVEMGKHLDLTWKKKIKKQLHADQI